MIKYVDPTHLFRNKAIDKCNREKPIDPDVFKKNEIMFQNKNDIIEFQCMIQLKNEGIDLSDDYSENHLLPGTINPLGLVGKRLSVNTYNSVKIQLFSIMYHGCYRVKVVYGKQQFISIICNEFKLSHTRYIISLRGDNFHLLMLIWKDIRQNIFHTSEEMLLVNDKLAFSYYDGELILNNFVD